MNKPTYLLICLIEECAEVIQRACKALRFGLKEKQEGQDLDNQTRLSSELSDEIAIIELLREHGVAMPVYDSMTVQRKKDRVKKYSQLSVEQGQLDEAIR